MHTFRERQDIMKCDAHDFQLLLLRCDPLRDRNVRALGQEDALVRVWDTVRPFNVQRFALRLASVLIHPVHQLCVQMKHAPAVGDAQVYDLLHQLTAALPFVIVLGNPRGRRALSAPRRSRRRLTTAGLHFRRTKHRVRCVRAVLLEGSRTRPRSVHAKSLSQMATNINCL